MECLQQYYQQLVNDMRTVNMADFSDILSFASENELADYNEACDILSKGNIYPQDGEGSKDFYLRDLKNDLKDEEWMSKNEYRRKAFKIIVKFMEENKIENVTLVLD
jgi:hypothetical protein